MHIPYKYTNLIIGVLILFAVSIIFFILSKEMTGFIALLLYACAMSFYMIRKYGNTLSIEDSKMVIKNVLSSKRDYSINQVQRISLHTENVFLKKTVYIHVRTEKGIKKIHLGTLSSDHMILLYDYLKNNVDCNIEIMSRKEPIQKQPPY